MAGSGAEDTATMVERRAVPGELVGVAEPDLGAAADCDGGGPNGCTAPLDDAALTVADRTGPGERAGTTPNGVATPRASCTDAARAGRGDPAGTGPNGDASVAGDAGVAVGAAAVATRGERPDSTVALASARARACARVGADTDLDRAEGSCRGSVGHAEAAGADAAADGAEGLLSNAAHCPAGAGALGALGPKAESKLTSNLSSLADEDAPQMSTVCTVRREV